MLNHLVLSSAEVHNTMISNFVVVTGSFVLLLVLLKIFAWDSIAAIMKKREDKIANDLDSAEKSRIEAAKLEEERQMQLANSQTEAAEIIKNARDSGESSRQTILKDAEVEVTQMRDKAHNDIANERQAALSSVKDEIAGISLQIAEKILNQELSLESHKALIDQCIDGLGTTDEAR
ncbi:F0F1 ATP synthase subunit B [Enterococcus saccharolyticus]|uniref:F0F1 ATP synthase subunit B n=1 Tax=Enterococcus saccharolyticus TaxID=41997 RepID=UPI0039E08A3E